jgi:hypothetical protein
MWFWYPDAASPPPWAKEFIQVVGSQKAQLDSRVIRNLKSDGALAVIRPGLENLGYKVESGKGIAQKDSTSCALWQSGRGESGLRSRCVQSRTQSRRRSRGRAWRQGQCCLSRSHPHITRRRCRLLRSRGDARVPSSAQWEGHHCAELPGRQGLARRHLRQWKTRASVQRFIALRLLANPQSGFNSFSDRNSLTVLRWPSAAAVVHRDNSTFDIWVFEDSNVTGGRLPLPRRTVRAV